MRWKLTSASTLSTRAFIITRNQESGSLLNTHHAVQTYRRMFITRSNNRKRVFERGNLFTDDAEVETPVHNSLKNGSLSLYSVEKTEGYSLNIEHCPQTRHADVLEQFCSLFTKEIFFLWSYVTNALNFSSTILSWNFFSCRCFCFLHAIFKKKHFLGQFNLINLKNLWAQMNLIFFRLLQLHYSSSFNVSLFTKRSLYWATQGFENLKENARHLQGLKQRQFYCTKFFLSILFNFI